MATNISNEDYEKWAAYIKKDFSGQSWETTLEAYKKRVDDLAKKVRELSVPKKRYFSTSENLVKAGATALSLGITGFSVSVKGMNISITGFCYGQDVVWAATTLKTSSFSPKWTGVRAALQSVSAIHNAVKTNESRTGMIMNLNLVTRVCRAHLNNNV